MAKVTPENMEVIADRMNPDWDGPCVYVLNYYDSEYGTTASMDAYLDEQQARVEGAKWANENNADPWLAKVALRAPLSLTKPWPKD